MLSRWLPRCLVCGGKGKLDGIGILKNKCDACKSLRECETIIKNTSVGIINYIKTFPVGMAILSRRQCSRGICRYYVCRTQI